MEQGKGLVRDSPGCLIAIECEIKPSGLWLKFEPVKNVLKIGV
jgi:hypothetical protein